MAAWGNYKANLKVDPVAIVTAELGESGLENMNIAAAPEINTKPLKDREVYLLDLYKAQFTKAWEIIRERKTTNTVALPKCEEPMLDEDAPEKHKPSSEGWQSDIVAFNIYLAELVAKAKVPDKPSLEKRVTIIPGGEETFSEVLPITDGAGGYVDLAPAEDTVQFQVNQAMKGQVIKWEFELAFDAVMSFNGVCSTPTKSRVPREREAVSRCTCSQYNEPNRLQSWGHREARGDDWRFVTKLGTRRAYITLWPGRDLSSRLNNASRILVRPEGSQISGPTRKAAALLDPAPDVTAFAKDLLRASMAYDERSSTNSMLPKCNCSPAIVYFYFCS